MRIRSYTSAAALVCCVAAGQALRASTIATFTLGGDHNQVYNSENVAPYAGSLTGSGIVNFFCLDFNLVSYFGATYTGTVTKPQTQQEEEVAFLAADALYKGAPSSTPGEVNLVEGPISFAIWQIMGTMGAAAPDPAAQKYVQTAQYAFTHNLIPQSYLDSVLIFTPDDHTAQRFITAVPNNAMASSSPEVAEPGTMALIGGALLLLGFRRRHPAVG
jgi:hypothetical protein